AIRVLVELGGVLDLVLRPVHEDRLVALVDAADHAGREQDLLPEDPRPGVDDEVSGTDVVAGLVDLADAAVDGLHLEPPGLAGRRGLVVVGPEVTARGRHAHPLSSPSLAGARIPL